ncbi:MAG TPA: IS110 family transposase [Devosia sp.]|nr:IS110 family transposase [Devosia sp.]
MNQNIILVVDYHDENCVIRTLDRATGEQTLAKVPTSPPTLSAVVERAAAEAAQRGSQLVWLQESTTGWVRVKELVGSRAQFLLANVLQMPLPPKAKRRKTDKVDTARLAREYLNGQLPLAFQPEASCRQLRRVVALREGLVARRTALRNWINRYLAHETWYDRTGLWSQRGVARLKKLNLPASDRFVIDIKMEELELLARHLERVELQLLEVYRAWPEAQRVDVIKGIGPISAVSILARIGPITRFQNAEQLISFAGLAPGIEQSDEKSRGGRIGGGGTDLHLRHYIIEATIWARSLPRYSATYQRVQRRRGAKIGRLVVGRMLLRSLFKMLRDDIAFNPESTR